MATKSIQWRKGGGRWTTRHLHERFTILTLCGKGIPPDRTPYTLKVEDPARATCTKCIKTQAVTLADDIRAISKAARALAASGLNAKAINILVAHQAHVNQTTARAVLNALEQLEKVYCK